MLAASQAMSHLTIVIHLFQALKYGTKANKVVKLEAWLPESDADSLLTVNADPDYRLFFTVKGLS